jgi:hypothetical protein
MGLLSHNALRNFFLSSLNFGRLVLRQSANVAAAVTTTKMVRAIKTGAVRDFLDNSAVSYQTAESGQERKTADIAAKARAYTMLISCSAKEKAK